MNKWSLVTVMLLILLLNACSNITSNPGVSKLEIINGCFFNIPSTIELKYADSERKSIDSLYLISDEYMLLIDDGLGSNSFLDVIEPDILIRVDTIQHYQNIIWSEKKYGYGLKMNIDDLSQTESLIPNTRYSIFINQVQGYDNDKNDNEILKIYNSFSCCSK